MFAALVLDENDQFFYFYVYILVISALLTIANTTSILKEFLYQILYFRILGEKSFFCSLANSFHFLPEEQVSIQNLENFQTDIAYAIELKLNKSIYSTAL